MQLHIFIYVMVMANHLCNGARFHTSLHVLLPVTVQLCASPARAAIARVCTSFLRSTPFFLCLGESFLKRRHNPLLIEASPPLGSVCKVFLPHLFCTNVPLFSGDDCGPGNSL
mmetsp:Transcript_28296/g.72754  ORF Transcript_28296/g.72754 Transcript_28296/m.72754 type:complete len:113 (-) Transcript_28296:50-388(-)